MSYDDMDCLCYSNIARLEAEVDRLRFDLQAAKTELIRKGAIVEELRAELKEPVVRFLVNEDHKEN